jgi:hypothetical protein
VLYGAVGALGVFGAGALCTAIGAVIALVALAEGEPERAPAPGEAASALP